MFFIYLRIQFVAMIVSAEFRSVSQTVSPPPGGVFVSVCQDRWLCLLVGRSHGLSACRKYITKFIKPSKCWSDFLLRGPLSIPSNLDLYTCGFPCQPFSPAGLLLGVQDSRGHHCLGCLAVIATSKPKAFVLENVENILQFPELVNFIVESLRGLKDAVGKAEYEVHYSVMQTTVHGGLPQHRERLYIVGLATSHMRVPFRWPTPVPVKKLSDVLDDTFGSPSLLDSMSNTKKKNLIDLMERHPAAETDIVADLGASYPKIMHDVAPCFTVSRTADQAYWSLRRCRPLSLIELMRLQGFDHRWFDGVSEVLSDRQLGGALGNAMTVSVLERVFRQIFRSMCWPVKPSPYDDV